MAIRFKIVFSGELKEGTDQVEFIDKFSHYFKVSSKQAEALLNAGRKVVIKKEMTADEGEKYVAILEKLGMVVSLEPMEPEGLSLEPMDTPATEEPGKAAPTCPKCGSERLENGECLDCGIIIAKYLEHRVVEEPPPPPPSGDTNRVAEQAPSIEPEQSGSPTPVVDALTPGGMSLEPMDTPSSPEPGKAAQTCPKCGSERLENGECLDCGIIIAKYLESGMAAVSPPPPSSYEKGAESPPPSSPSGVGAESPQSSSDNDPYRVTERTRNVEPEQGGPLTPVSVPAGHGWTWIADGFELFRSSIPGWLGATVIFIVLLILCFFIPLVGPLALYLFSPVIAAGFMMGCQEQNEGGNFRVAHLFSGFQQNFGQLVLVGVIYLGAMIAISIIAAISLGGALSAMGGMDPSAIANTANPVNLLLPLLILLALMLPVVMAYWFAPALVALEGLSAVDAMKLSFSACLKNILPFLVYGLAFFVIGLLLSIVLGIISVVHAVLGLLAFILWMLALIPVVTASVYTGYRDIFRS
jgi:ribosomal protein L32